jgi:hypothetical protein
VIWLLLAAAATRTSVLLPRRAPPVCSAVCLCSFRKLSLLFILQSSKHNNINTTTQTSKPCSRAARRRYVVQCNTM